MPLKKLKIFGFFQSLFPPLSAKIGSARPPKFLGQQIFLAAPFELFCRIFGHLATVVLTENKLNCNKRSIPVQDKKGQWPIITVYCSLATVSGHLFSSILMWVLKNDLRFFQRSENWHYHKVFVFFFCICPCHILRKSVNRTK